MPASRAELADSADPYDIAVVGIAGRFPGAQDVERFWENCRNGVESIRDLSEQELLAAGIAPQDFADPAYVRRASTLDDADCFDASFFGFSPREAAGMDPQARVFLETAWSALEHAGYDPQRINEPVGVFATASLNTYLLGNLADRFDSQDFSLSGTNLPIVIGNGPDFLATRVSYRLGLTGPSIDLHTACSSSLVTIHLARQSLLAGECRMALAGGVSIYLPQAAGYRHAEGLILSRDGRCRSFDAAADGTVFGRGAGCVALKRLGDAIADGDTVLTVIKGSAVNNDGSDKAGYTAPSVAGQAAVIAEAVGIAGVDPSSISYIEAHGTGTAQGDPIEIAGLRRAFSGNEGDCVVGTVKASIGHLDAAAGVAGFIKVVQMMRNGEIPPIVNFSEPHPEIDLDGSRFRFADRLAAWEPPGGIRRAGISAFGMGGTNAHVVVEQPPSMPVAPSEPRARTFYISGHTEAAARRNAASLADALERDTVDLADAAFTTRRSRGRLPYRLGVGVLGRTDAVQRLRRAGNGDPDPRVAVGHAQEARPRLAWLFTGQGAQYPAMGRHLYADQPVFRAAVDRCADAIGTVRDRTLVELLTDDDVDIHDTAITQPALYAFEVGAAEMWRSAGVEPSVLLGHSLGEFAAAAISGVFSIEDGCRLVAARGELMQDHTGGGAMAAVIADEATVVAGVAGLPTVSIAAVNGALNTVISGATAAIEQAIAQFSEAGITAKRLHVERAFHSELMDPMLESFRSVVESVSRNEATIPLISNVTGRLVTPTELLATEYWLEHVRRPVRFADGIAASIEAGTTAFLELGPEPVLGAIAATSLDTPLPIIATARREHDPAATHAAAIGALYAIGGPVDAESVESDQHVRTRVPLPTYSFERARHWVEPVVGRAKSSAGAHPLLGRQLPSPLKARQFEQWFDPETDDFLADHSVFDLPVFPAAGYVEMLHNVAWESGSGPVEVHDLTITAAAVFDVAKPMQTIVTATSHGSDVEFHSASGDDWILNAVGRIRSSVDSEPILPLDVPDSTAPRQVAQAEIYAALAETGLRYGPRFRGQQELRRGDGWAVATIETTPGSLDGCVFDPGHLDSGLQVILAALPDDGTSRLPVHFGRIVLYSQLPPTYRSVARVNEIQDDGTAIASLRLLNHDGALLLAVDDLRLRPTSSASLRRNRSLDESILELAWEPQPAAAVVTDADFVPPPQDLVAPMLDTFDERRRLSGVDIYDELEPALDRLVTGYFSSALCRLGWSPAIGDTVTADGLAAQLAVVAGQRPLLIHALRVLADEGILLASSDTWQVLAALDPDRPDDLAAQLIEQFPAAGAELRMTTRCGHAAAEVLNGTQDPLALMFPDGSLDDLEELYTRAPFTTAYNTVVRDMVASLCAELPAGRRLRILEIGAGTGGTASWVLPVLPADRTDYIYTDISRAFTAKAQQRFGDYEFVTYDVLDIDAEPEEQGYEAATFDLVLATNVLHATADIEDTLTRVQRLLRPNGTMVAVEGLGPQRWADLIFGMTEGWWRATDRHRPDGHPLIALDRWYALLDEMGFDAVASVPDLPRADQFFHQAVIVARSPGEDEQTEGPHWLVVDSPPSFDAGLHRSLADLGQCARSVRSADLAAEIAASGNRLAGVVNAAPLGAVLARDASIADLADSQRAGYSTTLTAAQVLARAGVPSSFRGLWTLTRGAQSVVEQLDIGRSSAGIAHATVWGLARVLRLEHPELCCRSIDLDPARDPSVVDQVEAVAAEFVAAGTEDQLAYRTGQRWIARLRPTADRTNVPSSNYRAVLDGSDSPDGVQFVTTSLLTPDPDAVAIEVAATGINFKDVLSVLGQYPGDPGELGIEVAGTVTDVGANVQEFVVGDRVMGIAPGGGLGTHAVAPAALLTAIPDSWSFEDAATVPAAFLTAFDAMVRHGEIKQGERILVHAAAGGVGMAATRLAHALGVEVIATAGTPAKRDLVRGSGVQHVFDSRSLSFRDDVLAATGGEGVDLVLNSLAGEFATASAEALTPTGRLLEIGKTNVLSAAEFTSLRPGGQVHNIDMAADIISDLTVCREMFSALHQLIDDGAIGPLPWHRFGHHELPRAFRHMAAGRHVGKVVVGPHRPSPALSLDVLGDGAWVITGGFGALGLQLANRLADLGTPAIALLGRSEPSDEASAKIVALRSRGVRVDTEYVDLADRGAVEACLDEIRSRGVPITGVAHAAGTLDDGSVLQQNLDRFQTVADAKVYGTWNLHRATLTDPLKQFLTYSSVAAMLGTRGQANHAAANSFMDRLCGYRRSVGLPAASVQWGAWSDIGAAAGDTLQQRLSAMGFGTIAPADGMQITEDVLSRVALSADASAAVIGVAPLEWDRYRAQLPEPVPSQLLELAERYDAVVSTGQVIGVDRIVDSLNAAAERDREEVLLDWLGGAIVTMLGLASGSVIDPLIPLSEFGLDSLMAVEFRGFLSDQLGLDRALPATLLFDHPSTGALARHLLGEIIGPVASPASSTAALEEDVAFAADLDGLTDEETEALLLAELAEDETHG